MKLSPDKKLDVREVLKDLDKYRPRRKGWIWRRKVEGPLAPEMGQRHSITMEARPDALYFEATYANGVKLTCQTGGRGGTEFFGSGLLFRTPGIYLG